MPLIPAVRRPHTAEVHVLRVTFRDDQGQAHQATHSSTYRPEVFKRQGSSAEDAELRKMIVDQVRVLYKIVGCELETLEIIRGQTREIGP